MIATPGTGGTELFVVKVVGRSSPIFEKQRFNPKQEITSFVFTVKWPLSLRWRQPGSSLSPELKENRHFFFSL